MTHICEQLTWSAALQAMFDSVTYIGRRLMVSIRSLGIYTQHDRQIITTSIRTACCKFINKPPAVFGKQRYADFSEARKTLSLFIVRTRYVL